MIVATKNGIKNTFSEISWRLMGSDKNGWVEVFNQSAENIISPKQTPPTGQKETQAVQVAENVVAPVSEVPNAVVNSVIESESIEIDAFILLAKESLSKNKIKDFFDSETENVAYKSSDNTDTLIALLAKHLNNDIELLKSKFSI